MKPHHFVDIIKLYGAGVHPFVPDEAFGHDFYRVANQLVERPATTLCLTTGADAICAPCNRLDKAAGTCTDPLHIIPGHTQKEAWNRLLDTRLLTLLQMAEGDRIAARDLCAALLAQPDALAAAWAEEPDEKTGDRIRLFTAGAPKYSKLPERQEIQ